MNVIGDVSLFNRFDDLNSRGVEGNDAKDELPLIVIALLTIECKDLVASNKVLVRQRPHHVTPIATIRTNALGQREILGLGGVKGTTPLARERETGAM